MTTSETRPDDLLDIPCMTPRDVLELVALVRDTKPRDGLRAMEDALLELIEKA